ncbi:MAG: hypothetical protein AAGJ34_09170 [Pseudomonadota bacterium]
MSVATVISYGLLAWIAASILVRLVREPIRTQVTNYIITPLCPILLLGAFLTFPPGAYPLLAICALVSGVSLFEMEQNRDRLWGIKTFVFYPGLFAATLWFWVTQEASLAALWTVAVIFSLVSSELDHIVRAGARLGLWRHRDLRKTDP